MKSIRIHAPGGPEVMNYEDIPEPKPGHGEALVKISAIGLNFIDVYFRMGLYKPPQLPFTPGSEAAGTVVAVGEGVKEVKVGDKIIFKEYSHTSVKIDNKEYLIVNEEDVLATVA